MEKRKTINIESGVLNEKEDELIMPQVKFERKYILDVAIFEEQKFKGPLSVIPSVLVEYLNATELRVFLFILGHLRTHGICVTKRDRISKSLGVSEVTISTAMSALEKMGVIQVEQNGYRRSKSINFANIQKLNDTLKDKLPGAARAFRKIMGDHDISHPTPLAMNILISQFTDREPDGIEDEEYD